MAAHLAVLEKELFPTVIYGHDVLDKKKFSYFLTRANALVLNLQHHNCLIGYMLVLFRSNSLSARLYSVGLSGNYRNKGLGAFMMTALEEFCFDIKANKIFLETHQNNLQMQKLCQILGYKKTAKLSNYYADGNAAFKYEKSIDKKE